MKETYVMERDDVPNIREYSDGRHKCEWLDGDGVRRSLSDFREPLFGFELELSTSSWANAYRMANIVSSCRDLSCHYDGAIEVGFEVRSEPASLSYFMNGIDWSYLDKLRILGAEINGIGERGFHVHIDNRSFVDDEHKVRFQRQILDDAKCWSVDSGWVEFSCYAQPIETGDTGKFHSRYVAVNFTPSTVEVRCLVPTFSASRMREYFYYLNTVIGMTRNNVDSFLSTGNTDTYNTETKEK